MLSPLAAGRRRTPASLLSRPARLTRLSPPALPPPPPPPPPHTHTHTTPQLKLLLPLHLKVGCPFCKLRFGRLRRKQLPPRAALLGCDTGGELPGIYLESQAVEERNQVRHLLHALAPAAAPPLFALLHPLCAAALPLLSLDALTRRPGCPVCSSPRARTARLLPLPAAARPIPGPPPARVAGHNCLHLNRLAHRVLSPCPLQRVLFEDPHLQEWLDTLRCIACGGVDNEEQLLICDGAHRTTRQLHCSTASSGSTASAIAARIATNCAEQSHTTPAMQTGSPCALTSRRRLRPRLPHLLRRLA